MENILDFVRQTYGSTDQSIYDFKISGAEFSEDNKIVTCDVNDLTFIVEIDSSLEYDLFDKPFINAAVKKMYNIFETIDSKFIVLPIDEVPQNNLMVEAMSKYLSELLTMERIKHEAMVLDDY